VYKSIQELDLPDAEDQDIIKDEIIVLNSNKAIERDEQTKISVHVYKQDENKVIEIITITRMVS
jgi:hypothetical protein